MIKNPEPYLITAGGRIRCRRCKAQSSRTKAQCKNPALKNKAVCKWHGGLSTGPKTKAGKDRIRAAHLTHGEETQEAKAQRSVKSALFRYLTDLGNHCNMFYKEIKPLGRPPANYAKFDANDIKQLELLIIKCIG